MLAQGFGGITDFTLAGQKDQNVAGTDANSKCFAKRSASIVAEVMMSFRSGRRGSNCLR
jgi:hypothetical protein